MCFSVSENSYSDVDCLFSNGRTPRILVVARAVCEQARKRPARASQRVVRAEARCCQRGAACESATPIVRALTRVPSHYAPTECARGRIGQSGVLAHAKWDGISPSTAHSTHRAHVVVDSLFVSVFAAAAAAAARCRFVLALPVSLPLFYFFFFFFFGQDTFNR